MYFTVLYMYPEVALRGRFIFNTAVLVVQTLEVKSSYSCLLQLDLFEILEGLL